MRKIVPVILINIEVWLHPQTWHYLTLTGYFRWQIYALCNPAPLKLPSFEKLLWWETVLMGVKRCFIIHDRSPLLPQLWHVIYPNLASITVPQVKKKKSFGQIQNDLTLLTSASIYAWGLKFIIFYAKSKRNQILHECLEFCQITSGHAL